MPRVVNNYACNHCDKEFKQEFGAIECEYSHFVSDKIVSSVYEESQDTPRSIHVNFKRVSKGGGIETRTVKFYEEGYAKDNGMS